MLRFGVHRGKTMGLVPITVVSPMCHGAILCCAVSAPCIMVFAVWGPPRENPGHRPNNRVLHMSRLVFLSCPSIHATSCIAYSGSAAETDWSLDVSEVGRCRRRRLISTVCWCCWAAAVFGHAWASAWTLGFEDVDVLLGDVPVSATR